MNPLLTIELVLFGTGSGCAGVEARQVRATRPAIPAHPYLLASTLLNVSACAPAEHPQLLLIKHADSDFALQVVAPVEIVNVNASDIHPLPPLLAARTQLRGLRALALYNGQLIPLFDLATLIKCVP